MHTPQLSDNLRRALLQAAIEGKLSERQADDGHAQDLLKQIQAEKAALVKAGRLKKSKGLPEIGEDEKPFEIPENWVWVRLGEVTDYGIGKQMPPEKIAVGSLIIEMEDIEKETYRLLNKNRERTPKSSKNSFSAGDVLYGKLRPYLQKVVIADEQGFCSTEIIPFNGFGKINPHYLLYCMTSPCVLSDVNQLTYGMDMPRLGTSDAKKLVIPLPPLAEQARIVAKLDALLAETDALKAQETALADAQKNFPKMLRASLLQAAIEGKLTERESEDGHAQELLQQIQAEKAAQIQAGRLKKSKGLPEISDGEKPFAIPENWVWVRLGDYLDVRDGTHNTPKYVSTGVPLITSKNLVDNSLDFSNVKYISFNDAVEINKRSKVDVHDIIFAMIGSIGNPVLVKDDILFCIKNVALFKRIDTFTNMEYIYYCLSYFQEYMKREASGGVQSFVALNYLRNYPIPLPPLAEQARIVAKLDALLTQIEPLENLS